MTGGFGAAPDELFQTANAISDVGRQCFRDAVAVPEW
jgi:hypothetical protein